MTTANSRNKKSSLERKAIALVTPEVLQEERVVLFTIDEDEYTVPAKPRPNVSLRFMRNLKDHDENYAMAQLMEDMLGKAGWDALCDFDALTEDELTQIMDQVQNLAMGGAEKSAKN
ncbi:hypothetical protein [Streptomyces olivochromogenes]|uniref:Tail assembly chaperone n=1 Tax=Streptomyces olivochromogenes TaxID=1963 RepID=A0A250VKY6_STROL|nr:hypothetical protein [Streptomyces olivochromogenes]GAX54746.1 hypothetical protein SO3561_06299 [Streptomyces olivochromogenes]